MSIYLMQPESHAIIDALRNPAYPRSRIDSVACPAIFSPPSRTNDVRRIGSFGAASAEFLFFLRASAVKLSDSADATLSKNRSEQLSNKCAKCGGEFPPGESCQDRFNLCLAKEFESPTTFGVVHHLTVASYMLQHNAYSRAGWLHTRQLLFQFVHQGLEPAKARKQNRNEVDSGNRKWSVTRGTKLSQVDEIAWTRTIADVRLDDAETYCTDVKHWAASVLGDTDKLIREL